MQKLKIPVSIILYKLFTLGNILIIGIPSLLIIRLISPFFLIRIAQLRNTKIGHYTVNVELYLCEKNKKINIPNIKFLDLFYLTPRQKDCNSQLTKMWKRKINILPWQVLRGIDVLNNFIPGGEKHKINNIKGYSWDTKNLLDTCKKNLHFTFEEEKKGRLFLKKIGIKKKDKFVCMIIRDEAYDRVTLNKKNIYDYHSYRNCDVNDFLKCCDYLTKKGFYIFRMGKKVKQKININNNRVIDYATNGMQSDFLDIYLGAKCSFWISTGTGLDSLAQVFRIPSVFTNEVPLKGVRTTHTNSIFILKHLFDYKKKRKLSISEILKKKLEFKFKGEDFKKKKVSVIPNSPNEILNAVKDFYNFYYKKKSFNKNEKKLQKKFWLFFPYSRKLHGKIKTIISPSFLKKNSHLLKQ